MAGQRLSARSACSTRDTAGAVVADPSEATTCGRVVRAPTRQTAADSAVRSCSIPTAGAAKKKAALGHSIAGTRAVRSVDGSGAVGRAAALRYRSWSLGVKNVDSEHNWALCKASLMWRLHPMLEAVTARPRRRDTDTNQCSCAPAACGSEQVSTRIATTAATAVSAAPAPGVAARGRCAGRSATHCR